MGKNNGGLALIYTQIPILMECPWQWNLLGTSIQSYLYWLVSYESSSNISEPLCVKLKTRRLALYLRLITQKKNKAKQVTKNKSIRICLTLHDRSSYQSKSMNWFIFDRDFRHEKFKALTQCHIYEVKNLKK